MYYTTEALILSCAPQGERGRQLTLLTEERGLVVAQGQGIAPARSKLGPSLTPYRLLSVTVTTRNIERVIGVEVLETFANLWRDTRRQGYAAWACAAIQQCVKPGVADHNLFNLLLEYLRVLNDNTINDRQLPLLRLTFAIKFIHLLGYHGQGFHGKPLAGIADQVIGEGSLRKAPALLAQAQKKLHEQVETILKEVANTDSFLPAQFLVSLNQRA